LAENASVTSPKVAESLLNPAQVPILSGPGRPGYVGRLSCGIGISDPGGSTPAPPPPAALTCRGCWWGRN